jgi:acetate kinase
MIVLVLNCGSSSLKYQLFDMNTEKVLVKGLYERIGLEGSRLIQTPRGKETITVDQNVNNHQDAIEIVIDNIIK